MTFQKSELRPQDGNSLLQVMEPVVGTKELLKHRWSDVAHDTVLHRPLMPLLLRELPPGPLGLRSTQVTDQGGEKVHARGD